MSSAKNCMSSIHNNWRVLSLTHNCYSFPSPIKSFWWILSFALKNKWSKACRIVKLECGTINCKVEDSIKFRSKCRYLSFFAFSRNADYIVVSDWDIITLNLVRVWKLIACMKDHLSNNFLSPDILLKLKFDWYRRVNFEIIMVGESPWSFKSKCSNSW